MRRRRSVRGSFAALILASLVLLLGGCSANDIEKRTRFGWPTGVTQQGERMRTLWSWAGLAALALGCVVWGLIFWCCLRYRKRNDDIPRQTKYNLIIETICVAFPFLVIVVLFWRTVVVEDDVNTLSKHPDVLVQVDAFKWNWEFQYESRADSSGRAVTTAYPGRTDATTGERNTPLALNTVGSNSEIPVLVIPVGKKVQLIEQSEDVVHSFWVPEFLFKRDVIPYGSLADQKHSGLADNRFEFTATSQGSYVGRCAELCGTYHSQMNFEVRVVSDAVFVNYLNALKQIGPDDPARQSKALVEAKVPGGPYATTTHPFVTDRTKRSASGG